jgi:hypothetical protein
MSTETEKKKTIYAVTQGGAHGDWTGPFYAKKSDAESHVEREKDKYYALDMWISEETLFLETSETPKL